jgi:hypothetical protein
MEPILHRLGILPRFSMSPTQISPLAQGHLVNLATNPLLSYKTVLLSTTRISAVAIERAVPIHKPRITATTALEVVGMFVAQRELMAAGVFGPARDSCPFEADELAFNPGH